MIRCRAWLWILMVLLAVPVACSKAPEAPAPVPDPETVAQQDTSPTPSVKSAFNMEDGFCSVAFEVDGGLVQSISRVLPEKEPYAENIAAQIIKALFWKMDHKRDVCKGDRCRLVYKRTRDRFKIRVYGIAYRSGKYDTTFRCFFFWEHDKKFPEYFTEAGEALAKRMKNCPLPHYDEVISLFRPGSKTHRGVKFRVAVGTSVVMPFPAVVERINWDLENDGLAVEVRYPGTGLTAQFTHLSAISNDVEAGKTVSVQTHFARTGVSGATGVPHMEYRLIKETETGSEGVDPFSFHGVIPYTLGSESYRDFVSVKYQVLEKIGKVGFGDEPDAPAAEVKPAAD